MKRISKAKKSERRFFKRFLALSLVMAMLILTLTPIGIGGSIIEIAFAAFSGPGESPENPVTTALEFRNALTNANAGDTIYVGGEGFAYSAYSANITKNLKIEGPEGGVEIKGDGSSAHFNVDSDSISLTLKNLILTGNKINNTDTSNSGGGIWLRRGGIVLTMENCVVQNCYGSVRAGIDVDGKSSSVYMYNCTVRNNSASSAAGGLDTNSNCTVALYNCTFSGNSGSGSNASAVYMNNDYDSQSTLIMENCTITDNKTRAIYLSNSYGTSLVNIANSTIINNTGVGVFFNGNISSIRGSIIAGNTGKDVSNANWPATNGVSTDNKYNIIGLPDGLAVSDIFEMDNIYNTPLLKDNGGSTQTIKIKEDSIAHDKIPASVGWLSSYDQRGISRPQGEYGDIGAVELPGKYTVTFDSADGSDVDSQRIEYGGNAVKPTDPIKEGHTFAGWYYGEDEWDFDNDTIGMSNVTLTARWSVRSYTVTFDSAEGSGVDPQTVEYGSKVIKPSDPSKSECVFIGWFNGNSQWDFDNDSMGAANMTLTARWSTAKYEVGFDSSGGSSVPKQTIDFGGKITEPTVPSKEGYTFTGWFTGEDEWNFDNDTMGSGNMTLIAHWSVNSYTVTFDSAGGDDIASKTIDYGELIPKPSDPVKDGYTFAGWYFGNDLWYFDNDTMGAGNMTLTAQWAGEGYTVTFDSAGGSSVTSQTVKTDELVPKPTNPAKIGYTFIGWFDGDNEWNFASDTMGAGNLTLVAHWTVNHYTVSFNSDGGSNVSNMIVNYGETVSKPANPSKEGYTFAGWFNGTSGWSFLTDTMGAANMVLTAHWTVNSYTVTFNSDGGSSIGNMLVNYDELVTKPTDPVKEGHTFIGWYNGNDAWNFSIGTIGAGNITLTARWTVNSYTVTFDSDGGSNVYDTLVKYGELIPKPDVPTKENYTLEGWYNGSYEWDFSSDRMGAGNMTLTAHWTVTTPTATPTTAPTPTPTTTPTPTVQPSYTPNSSGSDNSTVIIIYQPAPTPTPSPNSGSNNGGNNDGDNATTATSTDSDNADGNSTGTATDTDADSSLSSGDGNASVNQSGTNGSNTTGNDSSNGSIYYDGSYPSDNIIGNSQAGNINPSGLDGLNQSGDADGQNNDDLVASSDSVSNSGSSLNSFKSGTEGLEEFVGNMIERGYVLTISFEDDSFKVSSFTIAKSGDEGGVATVAQSSPQSTIPDTSNTEPKDQPTVQKEIWPVIGFWLSIVAIICILILSLLGWYIYRKNFVIEHEEALED